MRAIALIALVLLGGYVLGVTTYIEWLNHEDGTYLPRQDQLPNGELADGEWRVSHGHTPHDQLRRAIESIGLLQYIIAPLLLFFSIRYAAKRPTRANVIVGILLAMIALAALTSAFYRGYFTSLGW